MSHFVWQTPYPRPEYPRNEWVRSVVDSNVAAQLPVHTELLASFQTVAAKSRKLDVTSVQQPQFGWIQALVDSYVAQWRPAIDELPKFVTPRWQSIDVTSIQQPQFGWIQNLVDSYVQKWMPASYLLASSFRSLKAKPIDVTSINEPDTSWLNGYLLFLQTMWPAYEQLVRSFRTSPASAIDTRSIVQPQFGWINSVIDQYIATWGPAYWELLGSYRSLKQRAIDQGSIDEPDISWLGQLLSAGFDVTTWPAIEQLLRTFRTGPDPAIDVRTIVQPQFGWVNNLVDQYIQIWGPAYWQLLASYRSLGLPYSRLINQPNIDWLRYVFFDPAQWPAIDQVIRSFRQPNGSTIDVRSIQIPYLNWLGSLIDSNVAKFVPSFYEASYRSNQAQVIDVRKALPSDIQWIIVPNFVQFDVILWPSIVLPNFVTPKMTSLDVRSVGEPSDGWLTINIPAPSIAQFNWRIWAALPVFGN